MNTRQLNPLLYREGLRREFWDRWKAHPAEYSQFLKTATVDKPEIEMAVAVGFNRLYEVGELEPTTYNLIRTGRKAAAVDKEFKGGYAVSYKALEDDRYGKVKVNEGARYLAEAANKTKEYYGADILDDAFTGNTFVGMDGVRLCSASHTLFDGVTTASNTPAVPVGFSLAGVTALMELADQQVDELGDPIVIKLNKCIIPNTQAARQKAWKIFGQEMEPFTANNDRNAVRGQLGNISPIVSHYMTSRANYFMISDEYNDAHLDMRVNPQMRDWEDKDVGAYKVSARMRFFVYFYQWRGWYGANPSA